MSLRYKIIIINWNGFDDTRLCIESLLRADAPINQIIVVDNGSSDDSVSRLINSFGHDLQIIRNENNLGYAKALNSGIKTALTDRIEWFVLLNNDIVVAENFLDQLQNIIRTLSPPTKILSPLIYYFHEPDRIWEVGDQFIPGTLLTRSLYKNVPAPDELEKIVPVDFITGCCMIVHREVFSRIGLFDEGFFMYSEDADFCLRANRAGFSIICATDLRIWHKVASSSVNVPRSAVYWMTRSRIYFYKKYLHRILWPIYAFITLALGTIKSPRRMYNAEQSVMKPAIEGWFDGWLNRKDRYRT